MWAGVEPEPGQFNQTYVNILKQIVQEYHSFGVYFLLDMHQDELQQLPPFEVFRKNLVIKMQ